jgi:hypothetical protein
MMIIKCPSRSYHYPTNTLPTLDGVGHQRTESTNIGCNQWLSLAKIALKVSLADRNRSLVASTSRCGEVIRMEVGGSGISQIHSKLCSIAFVAIRVHLILRSFVVLTWMCDTVELV